MSSASAPEAASGEPVVAESAAPTAGPTPVLDFSKNVHRVVAANEGLNVQAPASPPAGGGLDQTGKPGASAGFDGSA